MPILDLPAARVLLLDPEGPVIDREDSATELIGELWGTDATVVAVPVERLDPGFFELSSGLAGAITQKLVNYRLRLVVLGDIAAQRAASDALDAYVWESNRGTQVWFLDDVAALEAKLT